MNRARSCRYVLPARERESPPAAWAQRGLTWIQTLCMLTLLGCVSPVWEVAAAAEPGAAPQDHVERGMQAFRNGHFEGAVESWHEAARLYERARQPTAHSLALTRLAQAYEALGLYRQALRSLETARKLAEQADDQQQLATVLAGLGNLHIATGPPD